MPIFICAMPMVMGTAAFLATDAQAANCTGKCDVVPVVKQGKSSRRISS